MLNKRKYVFNNIKVSFIVKVFVITSFYLMIGEFCEYSIDLIPPYGNILYHVVWTKYAMNIGYSTVASIIFYYFLEYHRFKKNKYQYNRMISSLTQVMSTLLKITVNYTDNSDFAIHLKSHFPDSRLKLTHISSKEQLKSLIKSISLAKRRILVKDNNQDISKSIQKMNMISSRLGDCSFFNELKHTYENLNFIGVDLEVELEYFIDSFEDVLEWKDLDESSLNIYAKKLNLNMEILVLSGLELLINLKDIIENDVQYVLKQ